MKKIIKIKIKTVRKIFFITAFLIIISVISVLSFYINGNMPEYLSLFIKDLGGCAVLSFTLSLGTHLFEKNSA